MRWPLEKVIRTTKQKFGAMQCQSLSLENQHAHLLAGFLAYAILEIANIDKQAESVDELVNILRDEYKDDLIMLIENPYKNNAIVSKHLDAKPVQKCLHSIQHTNDSIANLHA